MVSKGHGNSGEQSAGECGMNNEPKRVGQRIAGMRAANNGSDDLSDYRRNGETDGGIWWW